MRPAPTYALVRASAGTGKTYQLVETYAALVAGGGLAPQAIVAITFTRAAASELRRRIGRRLRELQAGREAFSALARAPIGTFHQLCAQWLKQAGGYGAAGPPALLDAKDADQALFVAMAQRAWFAASGPLAEHVARVARSCRAGLDEKVIAELYQALAGARSCGLEVKAEVFGPPYEPGDEGLELQAACAALRAHLASALAEPEGLTPKGQAIATAALGIAVPQAFELAPRWAQAWLLFLRALNLRSLGRAVTKLERDELVARLQGLAGDAACAALQASWQALSVAAWQAYVAEKERRHCCDYADLIEQVVGRLRSDVGFRDQLQAQIAAVLVDEAQDTDPLQRELIRQLSAFPAAALGAKAFAAPQIGVANAVAVDIAGAAAASAAVPASWYVVGDEKQCIYGFRGSDQESFHALGADVAAAGGTQRVLAASWRAQPALQAGLNALGAHLFGSTYVEVQAAAPLAVFPLSAGIRVRGPAATAGAGDLEARAGAAAPAASETAAAALRAEVERCADLACAAHAAGVPWHHMAILCRALKSVAGAFLQGFAGRQIPLIILSQGQLFLQADVRQWWSLLAWLADERAELGLAVALRSSLFACPADVLAALFDERGRAAGAAQALRQGDAGVLLALLPPAAQPAWQERLATWAGWFEQAAALLRELGPLAALCALEALFGLAAHRQAQPAAAQYLLHLEQLKRLADQDERRGQWSARAFVLKYYRRMHARTRQDDGSIAPSGASAVTLCSVHYAKGLEWPYVILPLLNRKVPVDSGTVAFERSHGVVFAPRDLRGPLRSSRWQQAQAARQQATDAEMRRLLYVAATRAKQRLDLLLPSGESPKSAHGFYRELLPWLQGAPPAVVVEPCPLPADGEALPAAARGSLAGDDSAAKAALLAAHAALEGTRRLPPGTTIELPVSGFVSSAAWGRPPALVASGAAAAPSVAPAQLPNPAADSAPGRGHRSADDLSATDLGIVAHQALAAVLLAPRQGALEQRLARCSRAALARQGCAPHGRAARALHADLLGFLEGEVGAQLLAMAPAALRSEWPVAVAQQSHGRTAWLRGQIDLLALRSGEPWLIDFKYAKHHGDLQAHARQLDAYALALCAAHGQPQAVSGTVVYLRDQNKQCVAHVATVARQNIIRDRLQTLLANS